MKLSTFLPRANKAKTVAAIPDRPDLFFYMEWTRAPILKSQGAENYWLSSRSLPIYDLSGPLDYNARTFSFAPAPTQAARYFPNSSVNATGILNGQIISQPLYDSDSNGFGQALTPRLATPFGPGGMGGAIAPAGVA